MILWVLFLITKLKYGKEDVNKLTFRPLYWALAAMFFQLLVSTFALAAVKRIVWQIYCHFHFPKYVVNSYIASGVGKSFTALSLLMYFINYGFFAAIMNENFVMLIYIMFQKSVD